MFSNRLERTSSDSICPFLITPRVLGTALDAARLTEEMKRITPGIHDAIRLAPRPPSPPPRPPATQTPSPPGPSPSP